MVRPQQPITIDILTAIKKFSAIPSVTSDENGPWPRLQWRHKDNDHHIDRQQHTANEPEFLGERGKIKSVCASRKFSRDWVPCMKPRLTSRRT